MKYLPLQLLACLLLLGSSGAAAQPAPGGKIGPGAGSCFRQQQFQFSPEQQEAFRTFRRNRDEIHKMELRLELEQLELNTLLKAADTDRTRVETQLEKVNAAAAALNRSRVMNLLSLKGTLAPQQFEWLLDTARERLHTGGPFGGAGPGAGRPGRGPGRGFGRGRSGGFFNRDLGGGPPSAPADGGRALDSELSF